MSDLPSPATESLHRESDWRIAIERSKRAKALLSMRVVRVERRTIANKINLSCIFSIFAVVLNTTAKNSNAIYFQTLFIINTSMVHPVMGEINTQFRKLKDNPVTKEVWTTAPGKEFRHMAQGDNMIDTK